MTNYEKIRALPLPELAKLFVYEVITDMNYWGDEWSYWTFNKFDGSVCDHYMDEEDAIKGCVEYLQETFNERATNV